MNAGGDLVPAQCKLGGESTGFCKQHSSHQNFGTAEHPNLEEFVKHHDQMVKAFNKKNGIAETKKPKRAKSAVKRALNPYMVFLAANRASVKADLLQENPELKGKVLAMAITSRVGRLWQASKHCDMDISDDSSECSECSQTGSEIDRELDALLGVTC